MPKFSKIVYLRWEETGRGEEPFLVASTTPDGEDGEKVAVYSLDCIKTRKITEELV